MGFLLGLLIVCALIAVVFGRNAAQGVFVGVVILIGVAICGIVLLIIYTMFPAAWHILVITAIGIIGVFVWLTFYIVKIKVDYEIGSQQRAAQIQEREKKENWIKQQDLQQRQQAITQLMEDLKVALEQKDREGCIQNCKELRKHQSLSSALPLLKIALNDIDDEVRFCASLGLQYGYPAELNGDEFFSFNTEATDLLCEVVSTVSETDTNRTNAACALGIANYKGGLQTLISHSSDQVPAVVWGCCLGLKMLAQNGTDIGSGLGCLLTALRHQAKSVRKMAIIGLGTVCDPQAIRYLQEIQQNPSEDTEIREAAGEAVSRIKAAVAG